jgi:hypothetical protein
MLNFGVRRWMMAGGDVGNVVDTLNSFLRGELSAVESYRQAIDKLSNSSARPMLEDCQLSHAERVTKLRAQIERLGGSPSEKSGAWGAFAGAVEGTAKVFGEKTAIAALEEGEDHGLKLYHRDMAKLDADSRELVVTDLLPEQERTHRTLSTLKHTFH